MSAPNPETPDSMTGVPLRRAFRPQWWAAVLTLLVVALTIRLGNWQGDRAGYRQQQQRLQEQARDKPPLTATGLSAISELGEADRYRAVKVSVTFIPATTLFVDNRIFDGKAGYGVMQLVSLEGGGGGLAPRYYLLDRGWVAAPASRDRLPELASPVGSALIDARLNLPVSRNPGTAPNDGGSRLNYVNIAELEKQWGRPLAPFVLEQTAGAGFTGVDRPSTGTNFEKNLIYQMQWYSFAVLAVVLFIVLSYRKQVSR